MKAKSINGTNLEEIKSALDESLKDGFKPTLAYIFLSIKQDRKAICDILRIEGIDIAGATSCGEFIDGHQDEGSTVIMLLDLQRDAYTILFEDIRERTASEVGAQLARKALQKFDKPAFILCSTSLSEGGGMLDGDIFIKNIEKIVGPQVNIYGGMAGDDGTFTGTYVFTHNQSTDRGIVALVLDENKVELKGMAISGWKPLGIMRTVTKSEGNWVYTIDGKPALDMYLKYLGSKTLKEVDGYEIFTDIGVHYPFQVEREIGAPRMVTPMKINRDENAIMVESNIPQGSKLRFSMPPDFDIVEEVLEKAKEVKSSNQMEAEALLIFSCAGRYESMGPLANEENQGLCKVWESPMAGFYSYGEFGRAIDSKTEYHSTTCCWVAIKEK